MLAVRCITGVSLGIALPPREPLSLHPGAAAGARLADQRVDMLENTARFPKPARRRIGILGPSGNTLKLLLACLGFAVVGMTAMIAAMPWFRAAEEGE
jgi:hypothetical protein